MYVKLNSKLQLIRYYTDIASWTVCTFQNKKCLQSCPFTELRWVDIWTYLQYKVYQSEVYRLIWFSGLFASYTEKCIEKYCIGTCVFFLPFTYLLKAFVSAQGCISYRRKTCKFVHTAWSSVYFFQLFSW